MEVRIFVPKKYEEDDFSKCPFTSPNGHRYRLCRGRDWECRSYNAIWFTEALKEKVIIFM